MARNVRNVAIIALVALAITVIPGGDAATETVLQALQMAFLAAIAFAVYSLYRTQRWTIDTLTDRQRATVFGAVAMVVVMIAGYDELTSWGGLGLLLWIALIAGSVAAVFITWRDANSSSY